MVKRHPKTEFLIDKTQIPCGASLSDELLNLPFVILPRGVIFPGNIIPISNLDHFTDKQINLAKSGMLEIAAVPAYNFHSDDSTIELSSIGTEAIVKNLVNLPNGQMGALIKGTRRLFIHKVDSSTNKKSPLACAQPIFDAHADKDDSYFAHLQALKGALLQIVKINSAFNQDTASVVMGTDDPNIICDMVIPQITSEFEERIAILQSFDLKERIALTIELLQREASLIEVSANIRNKTQKDLTTAQKKVYLSEQMRVIKNELADIDGFAGLSEAEELREKIESLELTHDVRKAAFRELGRMESIPPGMPEYTISHSYLSLITELPWGVPPHKKINISETKTLLDDDHHGLDKVKKRVLEHLAVLNHCKSTKGEILLLAGPPGVGKTSLAKSIAKALNRKFVRVSLAGVRDEAEIRGHRRTYVGSMPGKIITAIKQVKSNCPVILLDEIDKVGSDRGHGDVASALLELLDPEQNKNFTDHYLNLPYDLSSVVFIATANSIESISAPLMDRMELLELNSYTELEKLEIAKHHLLPKIRKDLDLNSKDFRIAPRVLTHIIRNYTRECGVRKLKQTLDTLARQAIVALEANRPSPKYTRENLIEFLGKPKFYDENNHKKLPIGVAIGLAYTRFGGDILFIETTKTPGPQESGGQLKITGSLGKVMSESVETALSFLKSLAHNTDEDVFYDFNKLMNENLHIHFPDGATPKDGPSAGVAVMCAIASLYSGVALPENLAMTGEVTLRGQVLPVGGIREKLLAAHRYGKTTIMIPHANLVDLEDIPAEISRQLLVIPIKNMVEALRLTKQISNLTGDKPKKPRRTRKITANIASQELH